MNDILLEYACYDEILTDVIKVNVFKALDLGAKSISVPTTHMSAVAAFIPAGITLSCPIDYPNGRSDTALRVHSVVKSVNQGATSVDIVASSVLFRNQKEKDFIHDLKTLKGVADEKSVTMRVMADYRKTDDGKQFRKVLELIKAAGIEYVYCSTGCYVDDAVDNVILCNMAQKDFGLSAIANGNIYLPKHVEAAEGANLFGVRFSKIKAMENCVVGV